MQETGPAARELVRLMDIMARLRSPEGCPWDREQTIDSLKPFVLEETYELLEAIDRHDHTALREELGDFLFEAVFLAQLESEAGLFTMADALRTVADKLVRRHPHVFVPAERDTIRTAGQVRVRWEDIKAQERRARPGSETHAGGKAPSLLEGIPATLPSLLRAYQIGLRAASVGFDWSRSADVMDKIREEVEELGEVVRAGAGRAAAESPEPTNQARAEEEMGDLLFALANLSRKLGIEPETALRKANEKFTGRFAAMERAIADSGRSMREMTIEELEEQWRSVKEREKS
jgi:nucleoside triphosphate diphosphatase